MGGCRFKKKRTQLLGFHGIPGSELSEITTFLQETDGVHLDLRLLGLYQHPGFSVTPTWESTADVSILLSYFEKFSLRVSEYKVNFWQPLDTLNDQRLLQFERRLLTEEPPQLCHRHGTVGYIGLQSFSLRKYLIPDLEAELLEKCRQKDWLSSALAKQQLGRNAPMDQRGLTNKVKINDVLEGLRDAAAQFPSPGLLIISAIQGFATSVLLLCTPALEALPPGRMQGHFLNIQKEASRECFRT